MTGEVNTVLCSIFVLLHTNGAQSIMGNRRGMGFHIRFPPVIQLINLQLEQLGLSAKLLKYFRADPLHISVYSVVCI